MSELAELSKSASGDIATLAKFALAQAKEADGKYDEASQLYSQIASQNSVVVSPDVANLRLAITYQKLGKKKEASDLLFQIADAAKKAKDSAAREATQELQKLDPGRAAQLPPDAPVGGLPF
jgi:lipopolysaccharide biosynthesis regulator YciM